jgi:predicted AlkP superfamily pyrophosphatase or phosphodiesterase
MKKVILILIDALSSSVLAPAMDRGQLPHLKALSQIGSLDLGGIPVFPSITPAATAAIVTGEYPSTHGVLGAYWYDTELGKVVYYGDDLWVIYNYGVGEFFEDFLIKLNSQRLQAETLFQTVERAGMRAASLNHIIYQGDVQHSFEVPFLLSMRPGIPASEEVYGPSILFLGDFVKTNLETTGQTPNGNGGPMHRFGFDDNHTANLLLHMAEEQLLPDFTLAYFPDNDYRSHEVGPEAAVAALAYLDQRLGELFALYGGLAGLLEEFCVIVTGDHSQSQVHPDQNVAGIRLDELLSDFSIVKPGESWDGTDQLMVCPDMRIAQIYLPDPTPDRLAYVAEKLLADQRIDQVIWRHDLDQESTTGYQVVTADRGQLQFRPDSKGPRTAMDRYGNLWSWEGAIEAVGGRLSGANILTFPDYPNAFERIAGGLNYVNSGHLWVTAQPGHEFKLPYTSIHTGGGSHGSLHVTDSTVPIILAGAPEGIQLPSRPRTVDIKPLTLSILGLTSQHLSANFGRNKTEVNNA